MYQDWENQGYQFKKIDYLGKNLRKRNFSPLEFEDEIFRGAILERANFEKCNIFNVHFQSANLKKVNFKNATIRGSHFEGADLSCANFQGSQLHECNFNGAKLQGANFKYCTDMIISSFLGAEYDKETIFPEYFIPYEHGLIEKIKKARTGSEIGNTELANSDQEIFSKALGEIKKSLKGRQGQSEFRNQLIRNYENRCAITGVEVPGLEAAHIKPYSICKNSEKFDPKNGILLRADMHTLFDMGLIVIQPDYHIEVKSLLLETPYKFFKDINNQILRSVKDKTFNPGVEYLEWRLQNYDEHIGSHLRHEHEMSVTIILEKWRKLSLQNSTEVYF